MKFRFFLALFTAFFFLLAGEVLVVGGFGHRVAQGRHVQVRLDGLDAVRGPERGDELLDAYT